MKNILLFLASYQCNIQIYDLLIWHIWYEYLMQLWAEETSCNNALSDINMYLLQTTVIKFMCHYFSSFFIETFLSIYKCLIMLVVNKSLFYPSFVVCLIWLLYDNINDTHVEYVYPNKYHSKYCYYLFVECRQNVNML